MSSPQEDFGKLKSLLVCKRYEQPPPGYFSTFSDKVVARLEDDELTEYSSWWQWLINKFDAKPIVACVYGCAVSGLLLAGFRMSQVFENEAAANPFVGGPWLVPASTVILPGEFGQASFLDASAAQLPSSVSPAFRKDSPGSMFDGNALLPRQVSFSLNAY